MKTAFCYHRYSTEMQRDSYTLEAQIRITKEIAEIYGRKKVKSKLLSSEKSLRKV